MEGAKKFKYMGTVVYMNGEMEGEISEGVVPGRSAIELARAYNGKNVLM